MIKASVNQGIIDAQLEGDMGTLVTEAAMLIDSMWEQMHKESPAEGLMFETMFDEALAMIRRIRGMK